jgi:hypothetical protein
MPGGTQTPGNVRRCDARRVNRTRPSKLSKIKAHPTSIPRSLVSHDNCEAAAGFKLCIGQKEGLCFHTYQKFMSAAVIFKISYLHNIGTTSNVW